MKRFCFLLLLVSVLVLNACTAIDPNLATPPAVNPDAPTPFALATAVSDSATLNALLASDSPTPTGTSPVTTPQQTSTPTSSPNATSTNAFDTSTPPGASETSTSEATTPQPTPSATVTSVTPTPAALCFGSLSGTVYNDANQNNSVDAGEAGLGGAVVELRNAQGAIVALYTTGNGQFTFPGLVAGSYTLSVTAPTDFLISGDATLSINIQCFATVTQNFLAHSFSTPTPTPTQSAASLVPNNDPSFGSIRPNAPTYFVSQCTNLGAPGTYLLTTSLVSKWDCIQIFSDNVVLDCQGNSLDGLDDNGYGVVVHQIGFPFQRAPQNIEIRNCKSARHKYGIYVDAGVNVYVHDNQIIGNFNDVDARGYGQFLGLPEGGGIRANALNNARIEDNVSNYNAIGIDIRSSTNTFVRRNVTSNNTAWGVHFYDVHNSEISYNTAKDNVRYCTWGNGTVGAGCDAGGIMLQGGSTYDTVKYNNILSGNGNGIFIKAHDQPCGDNNTIAFNHISGVMYNGIEASFCKNNQIIGNEIDHALDGIWLGFATNNRIQGGNNLHDLNNHGFISWNSQDNAISENTLVNDREGIYLYSSDYAKDQFFFVPGDPSDHISRGNYFANNTLANNAVAAIHFSNAIHNQVVNNTLRNNVKNFLFDGNTTGNDMENNTLIGGAYLRDAGARHLAALLLAPRPAFTPFVFDANGQPLTPDALERALASTPDDSFDLRWFKMKLLISLFAEGD